MLQRLALVIYSNGAASYRPLKYAENDAIRIKKVLEKRCHFEVEMAEPTETKYEVMQRLDGLVDRCKRGDILLVYFSGHGDRVESDLILVRDKTDPELYSTSLRMSAIRLSLGACKASHKALILDCCHARAGFKGGENGNGDGTDIEDIDLESTSYVALLASNKIEIAREFEHLKGSFLTHGIVELLSGNNYPSGLRLTQLKDELVTMARDHNAKHAKAEHVPLPHLLSEQQGDEFQFLPRSAQGNLIHFLATECSKSELWDYAVMANPRAGDLLTDLTSSSKREIAGKIVDHYVNQDVTTQRELFTALRWDKPDQTDQIDIIEREFFRS